MKNEIGKIFVACGFTWNNKGDAALLIATSQALREVAPTTELSFASFTPELDSERYGEVVVRMPIDPSGRISRWTHRMSLFSPIVLRILVGVVLWRFCIWLWLHRRMPNIFGYKLLGRSAATAKEILSSDLVLALPGGYLQATVWRDDYWLFHWLTLRMAQCAGKKVVIYAQSVGPFIGMHERWASQVMRHMNVVAVREEYSAERLPNYGVAVERSLLVPDAAFGMLDDGRGETELLGLLYGLNTKPKPWFGVSVREHNFPDASDPGDAMQRYMTAIAATADKLIDQAGGTILFVPQCIRAGGRDVEVSFEVRNIMRKKDCAHVIEDDLSPYALQALYSRLEILVGTRMHANILTMCTGTPVAAVAYERKTNGIMKTVGLGDCVVNIEDVSSALEDLVDRVFSRREAIRQHLAEAIPPIRENARATPNKIFQLLRTISK